MSATWYTVIWIKTKTNIFSSVFIIWIDMLSGIWNRCDWYDFNNRKIKYFFLSAFFITCIYIIHYYTVIYITVAIRNVISEIKYVERITKTPFCSIPDEILSGALIFEIRKRDIKRQNVNIVNVWFLVQNHQSETLYVFVV